MFAWPPRSPSSALAISWIALSCAGCWGGDSAGEPPEAQPDLILVAVAGLRAGQFDGAEAAFLGGLEREPTHRFEAAYTQSLAPLTSLASLLSGRYPSAIPFCGLHGREVEPAQRLWCASLPGDRHYLPGVLSTYGYRTAMFSAGLPGADVVQGLFEDGDALSGPGEAVPWEELEAGAAKWWAAAEGSPRLLVLVVAEMELEAHPELAPVEGAQRVTDETGRSRRVIDPAVAVPAYVEVAGKVGEGVGSVLDGLGQGRGDPPRWIALTSLHGMSVGELTGTADASDGQIRWQLGHLAHHVVLERTVHVPLNLIGPGGGGSPVVEESPTELVDLYPTFLELGGAAAAAGLPGTSLLGASPEVDEGSHAYVEFGDMLALRKGQDLLTFRAYTPNLTAMDPALTERLEFESVDAEKYSLFRVTGDPLQERNLVHHEWEITLECRSQLASIRRGAGAPPADSLRPERIQELRRHAREGYW